MLLRESPSEINMLGTSITHIANANIAKLCNVDTRALHCHFSISLSFDQITPFDSSIIPNLPLCQYMSKIQQGSLSSQVGVCFSAVLMFAYAERVKLIKPDFQITPFNVHRFFLSTFVIAHKAFSDDCYLNSYLAKVCGIQTNELNALELCLLNWLDFNVLITPSEFFTIRGNLMKIADLSRTPLRVTQKRNENNEEVEMHKKYFEKESEENARKRMHLAITAI